MHKTASKPRGWRVLTLVVVGLLLLCAVMGALGVSAPPSAAASQATIAKNITAYMAAWNAHDPDKAATYLAVNATFLDMTVGTPVQGRENIKNEVIAYFINACPDCRWVRDRSQTLYGRNKISYVWTYTGTNTEPWVNSAGTTPAANLPFQFSGQTFIQFTAKGKILHEYDYYDALGFYKQLGWL